MFVPGICNANWPSCTTSTIEEAFSSGPSPKMRKIQHGWFLISSKEVCSYPKTIIMEQILQRLSKKSKKTHDLSFNCFAYFRAYLDFMTKIGVLLGGNEANTRAQMKEVLQLEREIAKVSKLVILTPTSINPFLYCRFWYLPSKCAMTRRRTIRWH